MPSGVRETDSTQTHRVILNARDERINPRIRLCGFSQTTRDVAPSPGDGLKRSLWLGSAVRLDPPPASTGRFTKGKLTPPQKHPRPSWELQWPGQHHRGGTSTPAVSYLHTTPTDYQKPSSDRGNVDTLLIVLLHRPGKRFLLSPP
ncbi:hypothetical protein EYF80_038653 [Liparis tanakae]|uniref:Uncharacterized protein n=1 Tax=Liparis tanakae TaxID=230148 RepID=A0A4Z2GEM2_9TELE|nr:hypothetical protein EYF80_038653 [Liparis tanakae]